MKQAHQIIAGWGFVRVTDDRNNLTSDESEEDDGYKIES